MVDRTSIKNFAARWAKLGSEKSDAHLFWIELLHDVLAVERPTEIIQFELPVIVDEHKCFIDAYIARTRVLIEQKSRGIDLDKPAKQSDGKLFTPFEQAKRYADELSYSRRPRWIITSNFDVIRVYDMDRRDEFKPVTIAVERLVHDARHLNFLVDPEDENVYPEIKISKQAGEIVGKLYAAFGNFDPVALNKLCVRLVFCLYAEDAAIFHRNQFTDYLRNAADRRQALVDLFEILDQPVEKRNKNIAADLKNFPYVNGNLFAGAVDIPAIDNVISHYLLVDAGDDDRFNWFGISPTIFGALFESTLNPVTRRTGGMHYTSVANIHKVIDPLFLDDLHDEFKALKRRRKNKRRDLEQFQLKIAALKFLDPACGSGNFLTETYLSLRRLENDVIRELHALGANCSIAVSIENFYGVEVNDFAVAVARTALWIAENQMLQETEMIIHEDINFLPLSSAAHIVEGNALTLDWRAVAPRGVDYVIGNPPFAGYSMQSTQQKRDLLAATGLNNKKLDYVTGWFYKTADFMKDNLTRAAFVATNSITQGEQVAAIWKKLFETAHIDFAHRTFKWLSESDDPAAVHCVIVGFSVAPSDRPRIIFDGKKKIIASNINAYLLDGPNFFVEKRTAPLCDVPPIVYGSKIVDGGCLIVEADDYEQFIRREPRAEKFIKPLIGGDEFLNGKPRYCLWLVDATAEDLRLPLIAERVEGCRRFRLSSKKAATQKQAATPHLFAEIRQPTKNYILVPRISSERRKYIPIGFIDADMIVKDSAQIVPDADLFHFGVLMSSVHMMWTSVVCGRLEMRYNYSASIVYNNFVWCARSALIEDSARRILEARALYPSRTLASLYDDRSMPEELRAAHEHNDRAVLDAYGFNGLSETEIVARLMSMYEARKNLVDGGVKD